MTFEFGETVTLLSECIDSDGAAADPESISLVLTAPSGAVSTYAYPGAITRESLGNFKYEFVPDESRAWRWTWTCELDGHVRIQTGSFWVKHPY